MTMILLDRAAILGVADIKTEDVPVPEWGGTVRVKSMTGAEREAFSAALEPSGGGPRPAFAAVLVAATVVDGAGQALFSVADVAALAGKSAAALDRLAAVAAKLNGLGGGALEAAQGN